MKNTMKNQNEATLKVIESHPLMLRTLKYTRKEDY